MFYLGDFALLKVKRFFVDFFRDWWGEKIWRWLTNHGIARQGPHLTWKSHFQQQVGWGTRLWNSCRTGSDTGMSHQYNINWAWRQQQLKRVKKSDKMTRGLFEEEKGEGGCLLVPPYHYHHHHQHQHHDHHHPHHVNIFITIINSPFHGLCTNAACSYCKTSR